MTTNFECFVIIGDRKQTIRIYKDTNSVPFGDIYTLIRNIDSKQDISFKTHVFEIFDFDSNSFKRLDNIHQSVKYLSRIRVSVKTDDDFADNKRKSIDLANNQKKFLRPNPTDSYGNNRNNDYLNRFPQTGQHFGSKTETMPSMIRPLITTTIGPSIQPSFQPTLGHQLLNNRLNSGQQSVQQVFIPSAHPVVDQRINRLIPTPTTQPSTQLSYRPNVRDYSNDLFSSSGFRTANSFTNNNQLSSGAQQTFSQTIVSSVGQTIRPSIPLSAQQMQPNYSQRVGDYSTENRNFSAFKPENNNTINRMNNPLTGLQSAPQLLAQPVRPSLPPAFNVSVSLTAPQTSPTYRQNVVKDSDYRNIHQIKDENIRDEAFKSEGLVIDGNRTHCRLCCEWLPSMDIYHNIQHIKSDKHKNNKTNQSFTDRTQSNRSMIGQNLPQNSLTNYDSDLRTKDGNKEVILQTEGLMTENNKTYCQLCREWLSTANSYYNSLQHIRTDKHLKNYLNKGFNEIDRQFMIEMENKNDMNAINRRNIELEKFTPEVKQRLIGHGIRIKNGIGLQSYVCLNCLIWFSDSNHMLNHFQEFENIGPNPYQNRGLFDLKSDEVFRLAEEGVECRTDGCLLCRLCDYKIQTMKDAFYHIQNGRHIKRKSIKGVDRLLLNDLSTENNPQFIVRVMPLRALGNKTKEKCLSHGIRVTDGSVDSPYICTKCNISLVDTQSIKQHLDLFGELADSPVVDNKDLKVWAKSQIQGFKRNDSNSEVIKTLFRNEGIEIVTKNGANYSKTTFRCLFCDFNFRTEDPLIDHLSGSVHKMVKRGDYMQSIDALFATDTNRLDEFDVAFARMEALQTLDNKTKLQFRDEGIRVKDGIGSEAYICLRCKVPIDGQTIESAIDALRPHVQSFRHQNTYR